MSPKGDAGQNRATPPTGDHHGQAEAPVAEEAAPGLVGEAGDEDRAGQAPPAAALSRYHGG